MNTPDLSTVAAGQMRDEMKKRIEVLIHQPPELTVRLRIAEACEWLRNGAVGRALEVLEELLAEFERTDRTAAEGAVKVRPLTAEENEKITTAFAQAWFDANPHEKLPCGCPREMQTLCPHKSAPPPF